METFLISVASFVFLKVTTWCASCALVVLLVCNKWLQAGVALPGVVIMFTFYVIVNQRRWRTRVEGKG